MFIKANSQADNNVKAKIQKLTGIQEKKLTLWNQTWFSGQWCRQYSRAKASIMIPREFSKNKKNKCQEFQSNLMMKKQMES